MMEAFAQRYCLCNPGVFTCTDTCYVLSFAVIMLNTSLHNPNVRDKPSAERFVAMNRGINDGGDLPEELLRNLYESIRSEPFKIPEDDGNDLTHTFFNPDREGWLLKLGTLGTLGGTGTHPQPATPTQNPPNPTQIHPNHPQPNQTQPNQHKSIHTQPPTPSSTPTGRAGCSNWVHWEHWEGLGHTHSQPRPPKPRPTPPKFTQTHPNSPQINPNPTPHTFFNPDREGWLLKLGTLGTLGGAGTHPPH
ncbi:uncharacterized protein LOC126651444 [Myiozetetes cayanensis]|uniref:uncharacterized protein LOC126651444 n=1 Tax=Myiozetetes cayanensis TaxID=478635 RepID=UPI0021603C0D|nr:uncharacterized protein LOC126651444 [Myiozetetes cayanensis]